MEFPKNRELAFLVTRVLESRREAILRPKCSVFKKETSLAAWAGGQEVTTRVERGLDRA